MLSIQELCPRALRARLTGSGSLVAAVAAGSRDHPPGAHPQRNREPLDAGVMGQEGEPAKLMKFRAR